MAKGSFGTIISGWGLTQASNSEQPQDLDDAEDFKLSKADNSKRFGLSMSAKAIDVAIQSRIPEKTRKTTEWVVSVFRS